MRQQVKVDKREREVKERKIESKIENKINNKKKCKSSSRSKIMNQRKYVREN